MIKGSDGNVILEITDTTGSHQFPAMRRLSVVRGGAVALVMLPASTDTINTGHAFVLVFNISSKQSLTELKPIVELINEVRNTLNVADFQ